MPKFFIDTSDEQYFIRDEIGGEYEDIEAARIAAIDVLPDMARDELPDGDHHTFMALIRDENGRTLLQANLSLAVIWFTGPKSLVFV